MSKLHTIKLQSRTFQARSGQRLLDAALMSGIDMAHDCRAGRCGTCMVRVAKGATLGGETMTTGSVHACQAMVFSDLELEVEELPAVTRIGGEVVALEEIAHDTVEITIETSEAPVILPGQYCRFRFKGYPARPFSPTASLNGRGGDGRLRLNVRRVRDGRVTPHLGHAIAPGHSVGIEGPFGHAFLRPRQTGRLVLVGSGTGFAPIWAVAVAALRENPNREIAIIAASRRLDQLYMAPALELADRFPNTSVLACVDEIESQRGLLVAGRPTEHLPTLTPGDIVYAAGAPVLVEAVANLAVTAGATFYADPFAPSGEPAQGWLAAARSWLAKG